MLQGETQECVAEKLDQNKYSQLICLTEVQKYSLEKNKLHNYSRGTMPTQLPRQVMNFNLRVIFLLKLSLRISWTEKEKCRYVPYLGIKHR